MNFIENPCDYCGSQEWSVVFKGTDLLLELPGEFQFVRCSNCGMLRQNPRLGWEELKKYYPPGYVSHSPQLPNDASKLKRLDKRYGPLKRVKLVNRYQSTGRWIDVGCGSGINLQEAQRWGHWELEGLEPVPAMASYVRSTLNIPIYQVTFEDFAPEPESYDIVTLWDVIEHVTSPIKMIGKATAMLKKNGILVISTPNLSSYDRRIFKDCWVGYDLPRHLQLFPPVLLKKILTDHGYEILQTKSVAGAHSLLMLDLAFLNRKRYSRLLERILRKGSDYVPFRVLTWFPLFIIDNINRGTNLTIVARKK